MSTRADLDVTTRLAAALHRLPPMQTFLVAYSGGMDSSVLLHAMASLRGVIGTEIRAVHVNHGLSPAASAWAEHCERYCGRLGIDLAVCSVEVRPGPGESLEAAAREARYRAIARLIGDADCLLTAHHQDDQAETVLLQLLRGCGPRGIAAMPELDRFAAGWHARPLLELTRRELRRYAESQDLEWIEDPSNSNTGLRRNFLRHDIVPRLERRWPALARTLSRSAAHCGEAAELLREVADGDLAEVAGPRPDALKVAELLRLTPARRANALRHWFDHLGFPLPRAVDLARLHSEVMLAGPDSAPVVRWPGVEVHRHRGLLQAMRPLPASDPDRVIAWDLHATVDLPSGGLLAARPIRGSGLAIAASQRRDATIRFRRGGEQCHPAARGHRHALKKLLQEADMPPWLRERIPLVYLGEELAVVPGVCVCEGFQAGPGEEGLEIEWRIGPQHFPWTRSVEDF